MGAVFAVCGGKDGVGATTVAVHLAYGLSKIGTHRVCLMEGDPEHLGDIATYISAKKSKTFCEFVRNAARMDAKVATSWIGKHPIGFSVLNAAHLATDFQRLEDTQIDRGFKLLERTFDYTIVDAGSSINPLSFRLFETAKIIFIVTNSDILSINQTEAFCNRLRTLQFGSESQQIIINKFDSNGVISPQMIEQKLKAPAKIVLPMDRSGLEQTVASAKPLQLLNPKHPFLRGIDQAVRVAVSQNISGSAERSRLTRAAPTQPLSSLKKILPFTFGDAGSSGSGASQVSEKGAMPDGIKQRDLSIRSRVHTRLLELVDMKEMDVIELQKNPQKKEELKSKTSHAVQRLLEEEAKEVQNRNERSRLHREILDEALGLGPIEGLLTDDTVTEIMVNGRDQIYVEQSGKITLSDLYFTSDKQLLGCIERIVSPIGRRIDEKTPLCDARLQDGSRINIIIPPLALKGPSLTIRKFFKEKLEVKDLVRFGSVTEEMADFLRAAVQARLNIVVSGGTGSGKTTLLNLVAGFIPEDERIVTIEDAAELQLPQEHVITLESRPANLQGEGAIAIRELVKNSLRMRPDRIVVGECRSGEALDMLQAMNTGHDGSLTTIHSNNPRDCIRRIETLVMLAGFDLPIQAIREQIASAVNLIVQLKRYSDGSRKVSEVTEVTGLEGDTVVTQSIFKYKQTGTDERGKVKGVYQASGLIPKFVEELKSKGIELPRGLFGGPKETTGTEKSASRSTNAPATSVQTPMTTKTGSSMLPKRPALSAGTSPTKRKLIKNPHGIKKS